MNENLQKDRLLELLADQTLFGLTPEESKELEILKEKFPEFAETVGESFELTAALVALSGANARGEALPKSLETKILARSDAYFSANKTENSSSEKKSMSHNADTTDESAAHGVNHIPPRQPGGGAVVNRPAAVEKPGFSLTQWLGWGVAALACAALAVNLWLSRTPDANAPVAKNSPAASESPIAPSPSPPPASAAEQKQALLASAGDVIRTDWSAPGENENLRGEIVWSDSEQKGFMTFRGLSPNDPQKETYQLWIFDETQSEETPINGGVFDIDETGEVTVPIDAELRVKNPKMFAVTVEKPGGVVVSKREKIVALAKV